MTAELWPRCVLPGCRNITGLVGTPCPSCVDAFGEMLRPAAGPPLDQAAIDQRDRAVMAAYAAQVPAEPPAVPPVEWRMNQHCWACEERRKCRPDPSHLGRWICRDCLEVTP